jgi:aryl-alcohol dehydrogenase (NADP+)
MATIKGIDTDLSTLCLGGNVFGWTADEAQSFEVLDAYVAAGGNFIDSADSYSAFVPGNEGGESETIIGAWLAKRGRRDDVVIATKVGKLDGRKGLSPANIHAAADDSLRRMQTDYIDLYYAHEPDPDAPIAETLGAFGELIEAGKVRAIAASNYDATQLAEALNADGPRYVALQPHYNLVERGQYEGELHDLVAREGLACMPYWALAKGFLTGKYREGEERADSPRAGSATAYLNATGIAVLDALDEVAANHDVPVAAVAIAWLAAQDTVASPIASARNPGQLAQILPAQELELTSAELEALDAASAPAVASG